MKSRTLAVSLAAVIGFVVTVIPSTTTPPAPVAALPPTGAGVDISFPQCDASSHVELPPNLPFAVVGINGGTASSANPCFASEYNSALLLGGATEQPHASVYVNTGNPALAAAWWPTGDATESGTPVTNPDGTCAHLAGAACAYVYGYSMAQADYRRARAEATLLPNLWWLDVETTNTWQSDTTANSASLSGMVDYLTRKDLSVGIYSTSFQWAKIAGTTPASSSLAGLRSWLAGASEPGAPVDCEGAPLTPGGWVAMVQYVTHLDNDVSCHLFYAAAAIVVPSTPSAVGTPLAAFGGAWGTDAATYTYQWSRNGVAIPGANALIYTSVAADIGSDVTVTITGMKSGFSTTSATSESVAVLAGTTLASHAQNGRPTDGRTPVL